MYRILLLPGGASPVGSQQYKQAYAVIEEEAARRNFECRTVAYPGQNGRASGLLNYPRSLKTTLQVCREYKPHWLIGRSFGCAVAAGALGVDEEWRSGCQGAALWGPCLRETIYRVWPTVESREREVDEFETRGTYLSLDYFQDYPAIDELINFSKSNLRLVRGSEDFFNSNEDLGYLAAIHGQAQPNYKRDVVVIEGLKHTVTRGDVSPELLSRYFDSLFCFSITGG